jgi:hypothetical protein
MQPMLHPITIFFTSVGLLYVARRLFLLTANRAKLPPGPKPKLVIGNIADLPSEGAKTWKHWLKHKDLYGPPSSVTIFGQTLVFLNDARLALDLLEKRSELHSFRLRMAFGGENGRFRPAYRAHALLERV